MPTLNIKTISSSKVWSTPDGKKTIYEVVFESNGSKIKGKTYSDAISKEGFTGEVETYTKDGRNGPETFLKQASSGGFQRGGFKPQMDNYAMYLSYAKDIAVAMYEKEGKLDLAVYGEILEAVNLGGQTLFEGKDRKPEVKPKGEDILTEGDLPWTEDNL